MSYDVKCGSTVLATVYASVDAQMVRELFDRELRRQGFRPPPYPARLVTVEWRGRFVHPTV